MKLYLHDATPAGPGEPHGPRGLTHCHTVTADYEYQVEEWVREAERDLPEVVRAECPDLGREWRRGPSGAFTETGVTTRPHAWEAVEGPEERFAGRRICCPGCGSVVPMPMGWPLRLPSQDMLHRHGILFDDCEAQLVRNVMAS